MLWYKLLIITHLKFVSIREKDMENLVRYLISSVTGNEDFEITTDESKPKTTMIRVKANEEDMGKIIGRNGKTISSIRTILRSAGAKTGKRYVLRVNE